MGKRSVLRRLAVLISLSLMSWNPMVFGYATGNETYNNLVNYVPGEKPQSTPSDPKAGSFDQDNSDCDQAAQNAEKQCNSNSNPNAQQAQQQQNQSASSPGGSGQQNCDAMASILPALMGLLKGFQQDCQQGQANCKQKCQKTKSSASGKCAGLQGQQLAACSADSGKSQQFAGKKDGDCNKYNANLAAIASALANAAMQMAAAQQCQKDTQKDCTKPENQNTDQCKAAFNCNLDQYASDPKCVCARNPRASKDCPGFQAAEDAAEAEQKALNNTSSGSPSSTGAPSAGTDGGGATAASPSLPGFPSGGGGSGGSAAKAAERAQDGAAKTAIPEVNAGDYGGNNGAAGKIGGGYPDGDIRKLGQKKIMSRDLIRRIASKDGFTGAFGRDNWQKVHERYRDNRPTFVGP